MFKYQKNKIEIEDDAFYNYKELKAIIIPNTVTHIRY